MHEPNENWKVALTALLNACTELVKFATEKLKKDAEKE